MQTVALLLLIWFCASAQTIKPYLRMETEAHSGAVFNLDMDANQRFLVSASFDKTARVWDMHSGKLIRILRPPIGEKKEGELLSVAISPDGSQVAVGGNGPTYGPQPIYVFDRESGAIRKVLSTGSSNAVHLNY